MWVMALVSALFCACSFAAPSPRQPRVAVGVGRRSELGGSPSDSGVRGSDRAVALWRDPTTTQGAAASAVLVSLLFWFIGVGLVLPAILAVLVAHVLMRRRARRQRRRGDLDETVRFVDDLVRDLRSGSSLHSSLVRVLTERRPRGPELRRLLATLRSGRSVKAATDSAEVPDDNPIGLLLAAVSVLTSSGGPAAPALERLSQTVRATRADQADREAQAAQAMASAMVLSIMPLAFATVMAFVDGNLRDLYLHRVAGSLCLSVAAALSGACLLWIDAVVWGRSSPRSARRASPRVRLGRRGDDNALHAVPTIDLVTVVLGSGGTVGEALRVVARDGPPAIRSEVAALVERARRGQPMVDVLLVLPETMGEAYRPLSDALLSAERDGAPVGTLLVRLADEARHLRRRRTEAEARRLPVRLLFPLVACALPAVVIGAVLPLALVSFQRL